MAIIQIPVLFDMSGDTLVFGEELSGDFLSSHLDFLLDMTTEANDISLNAADISSAILIGDHDDGDNIFYSGGDTGNIAVDNLCNRIAKTITRGKLVHTPKTGDSSNSGIPMGGRLYVVRADGQEEVPPDGQYAPKYLHSISPIGDEQMLGEAMARVTSVHLMGTPLAAAILVDKDSVQSDLETTSGQTFNSGNTSFYNALAVQLSKVLGGSKSSAPMNSGFVSESIPIVNWTQQALINPSGINTNTVTTTVSDGPNDGYKATNGLYGYANSWESWRSASVYKRTSGFQGTDAVFTITYNTNQTVTGAWVQIDLGAAFAVTKYGIAGQESNPHGAGEEANARDALLLGSNDDSTWTLVDTYSATVADYFTGGTASTDVANLIENENTINATYRYWRFVVTQVLVEDFAGTPETTPRYLTISSFSLYDANNNNISLTAIRPINHSGPTIVVTASEDDGNKAKNNNVLQDGIHSEASRWKCHSGNGPFSTNANGDVTIHKGTTTLVGGGTYAGPWVSYDLGADVTIGKVGIGGYILTSSTDNALRDIVRDATVLGSSDNTNWNIVHEITNIDPLSYLSSGVYNGNWNTVQAHEIEFTTSATYRYWRLVIRATSAPPSTTRGNITPTMTELSFFQYDVNQKTYQGPLDASGVSVPALKSIYEQLMNVPGRSQIMPTRDVIDGGAVDNSNTTITGGFPFISGDKLVMYLRPKIVFAAQTQAENNNALYTFNYTGKTVLAIPAYSISDKTGIITTQTYTHSSSQNNTTKIFEHSTDGNGIIGTEFWHSATNSYNNTTGVHDGANANGTTTNVDVATPPPGTTTTHTVTVGDNGGNKFKIDGAFNPILAFVKGNTYIFDQSDATNSGHQIQISETSGGANTSYATTVGTPGTAGAKTTVVVPTNAPGALYYNCNPHGAGMGNSIGVTSPPNSISGEWGQVDIGENTWATELKLTSNNGNNDSPPREFRLLGSTNGTDWITLIHETEAGPWVDNVTQTFPIATQGSYRYYRYVVIKCYNAVSAGNINSQTTIGHFNLRGAKYPSETAENSDLAFMDNSPLDISGLQTNVVSSSASIQSAFPGNATNGPEAEPSKWGWMGSANSDSFTLDSTDFIDPRTIDLHIWKITITL